jgi:hypothetical protein
MAACLSGGGLPATTEASEYGDLVIFGNDEPYRVCTGSGLCETSGGTDSGDMSKEQWSELSSVFDAMATPYLDGADVPSDVLLVGTKDYTDLYRRCLNETGYEAPGPPGIDRDELEYKQGVAEASLEWADCARDNGIPDVKDPDPPVADGYRSVSAATVPYSISPDQLREVLTACPPLDLPGRRAQEAAMADPSASGDDFPEVYDPMIVYDFPGWNGAYMDATDVDPEVLAKLTQFQAVMDEVMDALLSGG